MNDLPRQKLCEIIAYRDAIRAKSGRDVLNDFRLCKALLLDLCGEHKREISVLVVAMEERVAADLQKSQSSVPPELLLARLTKRLVDSRALAEDAARWAVESWALALGMIPSATSETCRPETEAPPEGTVYHDYQAPHRGDILTDVVPADQDLMNKHLMEYRAPRRGDIRTGVVMEVNERGLVVDVGLGREGFVPAEDLERLDEEKRSEIQPGATVSVLVVQPEDREGHPVLSIHQAHLHQDWLLAEEMMKKGELYEGEVSGYNRGGLVVQFGKIRGFIPASQVVGLPRRLPEEERRQRLADIVGQQFGLKIIEVDRRRRRLIFSQRRALRAWQELQRERVMDQLVEGETCHGRVTDITSFGAFVDLGGADGLIHVSELSWGRVDNPHQVLKVGDEVDVYVLNLDRERKRIALSLKKLQPDPWTLVDDHYRTEQLVEGRVTRVLDFGAFVELDLGVEGLLHASEMIGAPEFRPSDIVHPGETLLVKIIRIDSRRKRIALSARQVRESEWKHWVEERQTARKGQEASGGEGERPGNEISLTLAPGVNLTLVRVPAGEFLMGSDKKKDPQADNSEMPQHTVYLDEYWIGEYPVTNRQYRAFVQNTGYRKPWHWRDGQIPPGKEQHPVVNITWDGAVAFCRWVGQGTGMSLRLPTEAEWEKAARGTDGRLYPWGNEPSDATRCNFHGNVADTTPVGEYSPRGDSPYGCVDMAGNVWEWVADWRGPYAAERQVNPTGPTSGTRRVVRGGSFIYLHGNVRCAYRGWLVDPDALFRCRGFRLVAVPVQL